VLHRLAVTSECRILIFYNFVYDRRFRTSDVPSLVSKGAPPFCTVYIISKGKISLVKTATAKPPARNNTLQPQQSNGRMDPQLTRNPALTRRMPISPLIFGLYLFL